MNTIIYFFLPTDYRITLAIDRCTALAFRFSAVSWWKIHSHVVGFLSSIFARFHVRLYIPWESSYGGVGSLQGSSYICISVKLDPFRCPARDRKSPPQRRISSLNICGKEVDLARNLFRKQGIRHQKSINIQESFRLGRRATLYRERLIKKEDFKRRYSSDRRRSFSISFSFYQTILESSLQMRLCSM